MHTVLIDMPFDGIKFVAFNIICQTKHPLAHLLPKQGVLVEGSFSAVTAQQAVIIT